MREISQDIFSIFTLAQTLSDNLDEPENEQASYGEDGAMAGRRSSVGLISGCGGAFGMTPVAITPPPHIK
jgi:hypothetical protein